MIEIAVESKEAVKSLGEIIDIFGGQYVFHWTPVENLPRIFSRGIYSADFANRVKDKEFKKQWSFSDDKYVYVVRHPDDIFGDAVNQELDFGKVVACVINPSERDKGLFFGKIWDCVHFRVAPKEIVGLLVVDHLPKDRRRHPPEKRTIFSELKKRVYITKSFVLKRIERIRGIFETMETKTRPLPIYGTSGDMYWPRRMTHDEIVEMLADKQV